MTGRDEAAEARREAGDLLRAMEVAAGHPRHAMGERAGVSVEITPDENAEGSYRIHIHCYARGSIDAGWGGLFIELRGRAGKRSPIRLSARGYATAALDLAQGEVLRAKLVEDLAPARVAEGRHLAAAAADSQHGELFTEIRREFHSMDGKVLAEVLVAAGGNLSVLFRAPADLAGARVRFRFFTNAGGEFEALARLSIDEAEPEEATAFWELNQTDLTGQKAASATRTGGAAPDLYFEFQVDAPGVSGLQE